MNRQFRENSIIISNKHEKNNQSYINYNITMFIRLMISLADRGMGKWILSDICLSDCMLI